MRVEPPLPLLLDSLKLSLLFMSMFTEDVEEDDVVTASMAVIEDVVVLVLDLCEESKDEDCCSCRCCWDDGWKENPKVVGIMDSTAHTTMCRKSTK